MSKEENWKPNRQTPKSFKGAVGNDVVDARAITASGNSGQSAAGGSSHNNTKQPPDGACGSSDGAGGDAVTWEDDDSHQMDMQLKELGLWEEGMTKAQKQELVKVLQESQMMAKEDELRRQSYGHHNMSQHHLLTQQQQVALPSFASTSVASTSVATSSSSVAASSAYAAAATSSTAAASSISSVVDTGSASPERDFSASRSDERAYYESGGWQVSDRRRRHHERPVSASASPLHETLSSAILFDFSEPYIDSTLVNPRTDIRLEKEAHALYCPNGCDPNEYITIIEDTLRQIAETLVPRCRFALQNDVISRTTATTAEHCATTTASSVSSTSGIAAGADSYAGRLSSGIESDYVNNGARPKRSRSQVGVSTNAFYGSGGATSSSSMENFGSRGNGSGSNSPHQIRMVRTVSGPFAEIENRHRHGDQLFEDYSTTGRLDGGDAKECDPAEGDIYRPASTVDQKRR